MDLLSHVNVQSWNIGHVRKISIPVLSLLAAALDLVSAPASQMYRVAQNKCETEIETEKYFKT